MALDSMRFGLSNLKKLKILRLAFLRSELENWKPRKRLTPNRVVGPVTAIYGGSTPISTPIYGGLWDMWDNSELSHLKIFVIRRNFKNRLSILILGIRNRFWPPNRTYILCWKHKSGAYRLWTGFSKSATLYFLTRQSKRIRAFFRVQRDG